MNNAMTPEEMSATLREQQASIRQLQETIEAMDEEIERVSAEHLGFKLAFIRLTAFLQANPREITRAREEAIAQAEDAIERDGISPDTKLAVLATIHKTMELAGVVWLQRKPGEAE